MVLKGMRLTVDNNVSAPRNLGTVGQNDAMSSYNIPSFRGRVLDSRDIDRKAAVHSTRCYKENRRCCAERYFPIVLISPPFLGGRARERPLKARSAKQPLHPPVQPLEIPPL